MATKAEERREAHREALINAAEQRVRAEGIAGLKARDLAQDVGIAVGAIYNLVPDLEELRFHVTLRGLRVMDQALEAAINKSPDQSPVATLSAIANGYLAFAREHENLWRCIFTYAGPDSKAVPDWLLAAQEKLFARLITPLSRLMPKSTLQERQLFAYTLFTAAHGIIDMALQKRIFAVPDDKVDEQLNFLLSAISTGLDARA